jgi:hypothetical protein
VLDRKAGAVFASTLDECPSVDGLCRAAVEHRMLGHLHRMVTTEAAATADATLVQRLSELQRAEALWNLRRVALLLEILRTLDAAGVQALPVKGPVWAELLYGDVTLRSWADIDLLVGRGQVRMAREILSENGFADCNAFNERAIRSKWGSTGQIALGSRELDLVVDLHWKLKVSVSPGGLVFEPVFARASIVELLGQQLTCPGKSDVFLMTCLEGARDLWNSVARILDLAVQINRTPRGEWAALLSAARTAGCERRVLVAVGHVCRVLELETPQPVGERLVKDRGSRASLRWLLPDQLTGAPPEALRGRFVLLRSYAAGEDHRLDGLRLLLARLLAPTVEDWKAYSLPSWIECLYSPLRPLRLGAKWCKHLLRIGQVDRRGA